MGASHDFGRQGEELAAEHLRSSGWAIVARNFRLGHKEVDIIARRERVVAFVEVKSRSGVRYGHPLEAVTAAKRREIARVAAAWISRHGRPGDVYRFDAVAILRSADGPPRLEHVEDAWRLG